MSNTTKSRLNKASKKMRSFNAQRAQKNANDLQEVIAQAQREEAAARQRIRKARELEALNKKLLAIVATKGRNYKQKIERILAEKNFSAEDLYNALVASLGNTIAELKRDLLVVVLFASSLLAGAQTVTWDFRTLNEYPCPEFLNPCPGDTAGCSVCNRPIDAPTFVGTNVVWYGIEKCPHGTPFGDGSVTTSGWSFLEDSGKFILASVIAFSPINIDTLVIRHRRSGDGPDHVLVKYAPNNTLPTFVVEDAYSDEVYTETAITGLGCIVPDSGMVFGFAQVMLQPYLSTSGDWTLDEIRVVGSPCIGTSIHEVSPTDAIVPTRWWNVLGQRVRTSP